MTSSPRVGRPVYRLYQLAWAGLDWLYPPQCGCGNNHTRWCAGCRQAVRVLWDGPICACCGCSLPAAGTCSSCRQHPPAYTALRSWGEFNGALRQALHRLKYQRDIALGEILARPLIEMLPHLAWPIDLVLPVPSGVARQAQRGYNQATFLALPVALATGLAYRPRALRKVRETSTQVGLSRAERRSNVAGAFQASPDQVKDKHVLIVDDVTTTGSTIQACAQALLQAEARQVFGLTLARAA